MKHIINKTRTRLKPPILNVEILTVPLKMVHDEFVPPHTPQ